MTERIVEPTEVGPIVGGSLRASDSDREQVATVLATAYAEGRITRDELDERTEHLLRAQTFDELIPITNDLVVIGAPAPTTASTASTASSSFSIEPTPDGDTDHMVAIFGGVTRKGTWRVRRRTQAFALFGGIDLDLRDAIFEGETVEFSGFWCFGGLEITVPAGMQIRDQTVAIFGGTDVQDVGDPLPGAPTLIIKGMCLFGGVSVRGSQTSTRGHQANKGCRK